MKRLLLFFIFFINCPFIGFTQIKTVDDHYRAYNELADTAKDKPVLFAMYIDRLRFSNPDSALKEAERLLILSENVNSLIGKAYAYFEFGMIYKNKSFGHLGEKNLKEGLKYFQEANYDVGIANCYNGLGIIAATKSKFPEALNYFKLTKEYYDKTGNVGGISQTLINLSNVSELLGQFDDAAMYAEQSIEVAKDSDGDYKGQIFNKLATIEGKKGNYKKSREYLEKAKTLNTQSKSHYYLIDTYVGYSNLFIRTNKIDSAIFYLNKSIELNNEVKNELLELEILKTFGQAYLAKNEFKMSIDAYNKALRLTEKNSQINESQEILKSKSLVYSKMGDFKEALNLFKLSTELKDSIYNDNISKEYEEMKIALDFSEKESKIKLLNQETEIKQKEIQKQKNLRNLSLLLLFISLILAFILFKQKNKQRKVNLLLKKSNTTKDRLFSIIGHDLKKPFSNITSTIELLQNGDLNKDELQFLMQSLGKTNKITLELLDTLLFWGMAERKQLNNQSKEINLKKNVEKVIAFLKPLAEEKNIAINCYLDENQKVVCEENQFSFIIRNLISNAIKFTPKDGKIDIKVEKTSSNKLKIDVIDTGVGLNKNQINKILNSDERYSLKGTENEMGTGLGLIITKEFISENNGEILIESEPEKGSKFSIVLTAL